MDAPPISLSKLSRPRLRDTLPRARLLSQLDNARQNSVIWIVGPPGAGKTTLASSYINERDVLSLWYQVDEGDADVASFFFYLGLAGKGYAGADQPLPLFTPEYALGLNVFTRRFFEKLTASLGSPFVIVLDNYQLVPVESRLHDVIATAAETVAGKGHILVASRAPPPSAFARLQANRQLEMIDWDSLKLRDSEVEGLYRLLSDDQNPSPALLQNLCARCGGWTAGLILLLRGFGGSVDDQLECMSEASSQQILFDYFAEENFKQQDAAIQAFLLRTSILPRVTPEAARELSGNQDAERILAQLNANHYFTERHSISRPFYQYHPLFREYLIATAKRDLAADEFRGLQEQGAALLEQSGDVESAMDLYLSAQNWTAAAQAICRSAQTLIAQGRGETLLHWSRRIPESVMQESLWLQFWTAMASMGPAPLETRELLQQTYGNFKAAGDLAGTCMALAGIVDTFSFGWNDFNPLDYWIDELESVLAEHDALPSPQIQARVTVAMFTALMHRRPQNADLELWAQRAHEVARNSPAPEYRLVIGLHLGTYYVWWGRHRDMQLLIDELRPLVQEPNIAPVARIMFQIIEAMYCTRSLEDDGVPRARAALELADQSGVYMLNSLALGFAALASIQKGDFDGAAGYLSRFAAILHPQRPLDQGFYHWLHGQLAYVQGNTGHACHHARKCAEIARASGSAFHANMTPISLARMLVETGEYREAEETIRRIWPAIRDMRIPTLEYESLLVQAQCAFAQKMDATGLDYLAEGLHLMANIGSVTTVWWNSERMTPLLVRALEAGIEPDQVRTMITAHRLVPEQPIAALEHWPWPVRIRALGGFELERDGEPLVSRGKAQKKTLELLKAIVGFGGQNVSGTELADALWPDSEADAAMQSLKTALHRLRKLLGDDEAIEVSEGKVSLSPRHCWSDVWAFEHFIRTSRKLNGEGDNSKSAIALYRGPFLGSDESFAWSIACRERLHNRFVNYAVTLGRNLEQQDEWEQAAESYEQGLQIDDRVESFYQGMMRCYAALGRHAEGIATFERCSRTIEARFGVPPSDATMRIAERLRTPR